MKLFKSLWDKIGMILLNKQWLQKKKNQLLILLFAKDPMHQKMYFS